VLTLRSRGSSRRPDGKDGVASNLRSTRREHRGDAARALANTLANAQYRTLDGQTHMVKAIAHAPVLAEFFRGGSRRRMVMS